MGNGETDDIGDVVQTEMAKVATLKANILATISGSKVLSPGLISSIRINLSAWHTHLPRRMRLLTMVEMGIEQQHQHKIYFVHLLYLGALMLLQRCIMFHWLTGEEDTEARLAVCTETLESIQDGYMAARQSVRILALLKQEGGAVKRCWICIFHSYVAGLLIIQESFQKLLYRTETQIGLDESLMLVNQAVDVLTFCATDDTVARGLLRLLKTYHQALASISATGVELYMQLNDMNNQPTAHFAINDPTFFSSHGTTNLHQTARELLQLICRPFGNAREFGLAEAECQSSWKLQRNMDETAFGVHLDWRWDTLCHTFKQSPSTSDNTSVPTPNSDDGLAYMNELPMSSHFLDSTRPSGWCDDAWGNINMHDAVYHP